MKIKQFFVLEIVLCLFLVYSESASARPRPPVRLPALSGVYAEQGGDSMLFLYVTGNRLPRHPDTGEKRHLALPAASQN